MIPLPSCRKECSDADAVLNFSQLLQHISLSNHRNLWKNAYEKYAGQQSKVLTKESINKNERNAINLVPYDAVLLEAIMRTYGSSVVHVKLDKLKSIDEIGRGGSEKKRPMENYSRFEPHINQYPCASVIETSTHYVVVYGEFIQNNLYDCVTYSPAIMDTSYNKPLFMIYQLLQLTRTLHERGLLLGNVGLDDIFLRDNLWLQVMPQINLNILQCTDGESAAATTTAAAESFASMPRKMSFKLSTTDYLSFSLKDYCEMWCTGRITNFDYLTILNNLSGRRIGDPGFHHIMPWVTDFVSRNGMNWRDLTKSKYRLNKGDTQLDLMFVPSNSSAGNNMPPHHVSDVLSEITYYVYMARRTPKSLLCKHVRPIWVAAEYPAAIARLYDWTPDECIPEFFTDPLVFKSIHEDLPDLEVPTWSTCPEDFIARHREALESQYVSERLHHWIDLNFGHKLAGNAAIKAKNVYLSMVDGHQTLCKHGIVQLFTHPHPPKQYQTVWTSKTPPRIYTQSENRRRLSRSTEDLSNKYLSESMYRASLGQTVNSASPSRGTMRANSKTRTQSPHIPEDAAAANNNIERSTSLHSNVLKSQNQIFLPKDYNPMAAITAVENMEIFLSKTFYNNLNSGTLARNTIDYAPNKSTAAVASNAHAAEDGFTNKIFADRFEETLLKDTKRLHNLNHKNLFVQNSTRNFKQIISDHRYRELQVIACIIVEIFLANKMRPLGSSSANQTFEQRVEACKSVLKVDYDLLPKCVQYPVKLLFACGEDTTGRTMTDIGLPKPSANQILQPFLSNFLFPFPHDYLRVYALLKSLAQYEQTGKLLETYTYFDCDGSNCSKYERLDKARVAFKRKIAECKVMAFVWQVEGLLTPGYDQFNLVDLILPHVIELLRDDDTSILAAWYLFDRVAVALGPKATQRHLLAPILKLYEADCDERINFLNSNFDSTMKFSTSSAFKSKKTIKLYHHSFLLRLIVRFGLQCFLNNFISPLIEAIGGYKEPLASSPYHIHDERVGHRGDQKVTRPNKNLMKMCNDEASPGPDVIDKRSESDDMFAFDQECDDTAQKPVVPSINLTDSSDNDVDTLSRIIDQFEINITGGKGIQYSPIFPSSKQQFTLPLYLPTESVLDLRFNHSNAMEVTEDTTLSESAGGKTSDMSDLSFDENRFAENVQNSSSATDLNDLDASGGPISPTIPIPTTASKRNQFSTIDCEIGSKQSTDGEAALAAAIADSNATSTSETRHRASISSSSRLSEPPTRQQSQQEQYKISDMSAESLIWLSHRLGPVLTARYLTRNLLKMLTLCYVGQENLLPDLSGSDLAANENGNLLYFSIADGRIVGDRNAVKVLECLTSITAIFGDHFILLQYFPHITELIALCKRRITSSLEGGLISSLQLLKYLVPCLSDTVIMDQLHDTLLKSIIHPIIRLIGSTRCLMPSGFLARSVLARKLLDAIYVLAVRIGPEMTKEHLCIPALQR